LTRGGAADVDAVHPHVELVLHVTALLVVVEDEAAVGPKVKPVPLPPAQDGACGRETQHRKSFIEQITTN